MLTAFLLALGMVALLGVSASHPYDVEDYIDSYDEFLALAARKSKSYGN